MSTADPRREYVRNAIVDALGLPSDKVWLYTYVVQTVACKVPSCECSSYA